MSRLRFLYVDSVLGISAQGLLNLSKATSNRCEYYGALKECFLSLERETFTCGKYPQVSSLSREARWSFGGFELASNLNKEREVGEISGSSRWSLALVPVIN